MEMEVLAERLRAAVNARDIDTLRSLLAPDAIWGEDPEAGSFCRDRDEIIRNLKRILAEGIHATIEETTTGPRGIAARLEVEWPDPATARRDPVTFHQAYIVTDGLVAEIHGHDDRDSALAAILD